MRSDETCSEPLESLYQRRVGIARRWGRVVQCTTSDVYSIAIYTGSSRDVANSTFGEKQDVCRRGRNWMTIFHVLACNYWPLSGTAMGARLQLSSKMERFEQCAFSCFPNVLWKWTNFQSGREEEFYQASNGAEVWWKGARWSSTPGVLRLWRGEPCALATCDDCLGTGLKVQDA